VGLARPKRHGAPRSCRKPAAAIGRHRLRTPDAGWVISAQRESTCLPAASQRRAALSGEGALAAYNDLGRHAPRRRFLPRRRAALTGRWRARIHPRPAAGGGSGGRRRVCWSEDVCLAHASAVSPDGPDGSISANYSNRRRFWPWARLGRRGRTSFPCFSGFFCPLAARLRRRPWRSDFRVRPYGSPLLLMVRAWPRFLADGTLN